MENSFFNEAPKFKTPEEELSYLRAHVAKREEELKSLGHTENAREDATHDVVGVYKTVPTEQVVHESNILSNKEAQGIVLALKPESHDTVMEELLGIVVTKGVRNAIDVAEKMNSPHINDDFHRILVQYLKADPNKLDSKEGTPLYRSVHMTLFEITLPPPTTIGY